MNNLLKTIQIWRELDAANHGLRGIAPPPILGDEGNYQLRWYEVIIKTTRQLDEKVMARIEVKLVRVKEKNDFK